MKKRQIRNALGGVTTTFEQKHYQNFMQDVTKDRLDTSRGIIVKCNTITNYDIKLLSSGEIIPGVGVKGKPKTPYPPGKEVILAFPLGHRYQILIDAAVYESASSSSQSQQPSSSYNTTQDRTEIIALQSKQLLSSMKVILLDTSDEDFVSGYTDKLLPQSLKLRDVPAANLPDHASVHAQGGSDPITPETLIGTKFGLTQLVSGTIVVNTALVTANSRIFLTGQDSSVTGSLNVSARVVGVSFTILSSKGTDSGKVAWLLLEP